MIDKCPLAFRRDDGEAAPAYRVDLNELAALQLGHNALPNKPLARLITPPHAPSDKLPVVPESFKRLAPSLCQNRAHRLSRPPERHAPASQQCKDNSGPEDGNPSEH